MPKLDASAEISVGLPGFVAIFLHKNLHALITILQINDGII